MSVYKDFWLEWEKRLVAAYATHSDDPWYCKRESVGDKLDKPGSRSRYRTTFEIDKDRITNSQAFRRLEYKTQVFVTHEGDNYRTRLTHSLEVSEIARHIARSLRLNEHLVEAIALGHDLGHAPYGHTAEGVLNGLLKKLAPQSKIYFSHNNHSVNVVDQLEPGYDWDNREKRAKSQGLNLTHAVREGILTHTSMGFRGKVHGEVTFGTNETIDDSIRNQSEVNTKRALHYPSTLEGQVIRIADNLAHRIHDIEDGLRSKMLTKFDVSSSLELFFKDMDKEGNFIEESSFSSGSHLSRKQNCYGNSLKEPTVSKSYLWYIKSIMDVESDKDIPKYIRSKHNEPEYIESINRQLLDPEVKERITRIAKVAYLLHMWRNDSNLSLEDVDVEVKALRVRKYVRILEELLKKQESSPAYHIVAFLRGVMTANVIEHSWWFIQHTLDPNFRSNCPRGDYPQKTKSAKGYYVIFVVVHGVVLDNEWKSLKSPENLFAYRFRSKNERDTWVIQNINAVLESNGRELLDGNINKKRVINIVRLNMTRSGIVYLSETDKSMEKIETERVRLYFTGYKEQCPGNCVKGVPQKMTCSNYSKRDGIDITTCEGCEYYNPMTKYPDIRRIVHLETQAEKLDKVLRDLIERKIHSHSRVARMNYMGSKILKNILDIYLRNPRNMHDRVWLRLRDYGLSNLTRKLADWIALHETDTAKEQDRQEIIELLAKSVIDETTDDINITTDDGICLLRLIVNHVAGMTDRYIVNEYNRLNQGGREVEQQDDTYYFY